MYIYENKSTKKRIEWKVVLSYIKKKENCNNWQPCFSQPGANMTPPVITSSKKHNVPKNMTMRCTCTAVQVCIFEYLRIWSGANMTPPLFPVMIRVNLCQIQKTKQSFSSKDQRKT